MQDHLVAVYKRFVLPIQEGPTESRDVLEAERPLVRSCMHASATASSSECLGVVCRRSGEVPCSVFTA